MVSWCLVIVVLFMLVVIFVLLFWVFGLIKDVVIVFSGVLLVLIGGVLVFVVWGILLLILVGVGFIVLFGVVVFNGLVMISFVCSFCEGGLLFV